jgi:hypothetical protein
MPQKYIYYHLLSMYTSIQALIISIALEMKVNILPYFRDSKLRLYRNRDQTHFIYFELRLSQNKKNIRKAHSKFLRGYEGGT